LSEERYTLSTRERPAQIPLVIDSEEQRIRNEALIQLIREWLADESGYDEETWPIVKQLIEENRMSYRRRFEN
jgi:hypothetical protein